MKTIRSGLLRYPLVAFFLLAYGITWAFELPALLGRPQFGTDRAEGTPFLVLGSFGPLLAALILSAASEGWAGVTTWLKPLLPWRARFRWYLFGLYGLLGFGLLAVLLLGVASLQELLDRLPFMLLRLPVYALTIFLVLGPLGEEPGWRGYALPRLQSRHSSLVASLILGVLWAFWHAPLMRFPDWRGDLPLGVFVVLYPLYIIPLSIIFTWVYNRANGSVLVTMVLHAAFNYTVFMFSDAFEIGRYDQRAVLAVTSGLLWSLVAALLSAYGRDLGLRRG